MPVHPQIAAFLSSLPPSDATVPSVADWRAIGEEHVPPLAERLSMHRVEDLDAKTSSGNVPIRVYTPIEHDSYGLIVYFHGGAFFSGSLDTHDGIARSLAKATGQKVISVGYRLAPEANYPAGLDDCSAVVRWVERNGEALHWDGECLALAGDSSGGNFVAVVSAIAREFGFDKITHQILLYPSVDLDFEVGRYASLSENATGFGLETVALKPHNSFYISSGADPADPRVSPIKRQDLSGLPPALVITAECDPLRDEGEAYAERLSQAGVPVKLIRYPGATHGFIQYFSWLPEYVGVFQDVADFLKSTAIS